MGSSVAARARIVFFMSSPLGRILPS